MCNDQDGRKEKTRKARYAGRREARDSITAIAKAEDVDWETFLDRKHSYFSTTIDEDFQYYAEVTDELGLPDGTFVVGIGFEEGFRFDDFFGAACDRSGTGDPPRFAEIYNIQDGTRYRVKV